MRYPPSWDVCRRDGMMTSSMLCSDIRCTQLLCIHLCRLQYIMDRVYEDELYGYTSSLSLLLLLAT